MDNLKVVDNRQVGGRQSIKARRRKVKKLYIVAGILVLFCTVGSIFSVFAYKTYSAKYYRDVSLAQQGIQHLRAGMTLLETVPRSPFNAPAVQTARREFSSASTVFAQLDGDLQSLPGVSTSLPVYGARLGAALHLLPIAIEASQMGTVACDTLDLLIARLQDPLHSQVQGLTMADLAELGKNVHLITATLNRITDQVNRLQPSDLQLDPRLRAFVDTFRRDGPTLQAWLGEAEQLLPVAPSLLGIGAPANYLIEVLDSTELRPGGGFIGNYGIATFSGGRLSAARITDVDLLDRPFEAAGHVIPYPAAYTWFDLAPGGWSFRDSNLDADFPTAARYGELTYKEEGGDVPVQGVIAMSPTLIERALTITGPIDVPEYHQTVTAQNLIALIHYYQLGAGTQGTDTTPAPGGHSSERKRFTELLAENFLARVRQLPSPALGKFLQLMGSSVRSKDLQVYFNSSTAEHLLQRYGLDAAIQSPAADSLFVVDANIAGNKANNFITYTLNDRVTIDSGGNALHHTTISYTWTKPGDVYGRPFYRDYVRVYVPPGGKLQTQGGWEPRGTSEAFGREVWAGLFTLPFGQSGTITLNWEAPGAASKGAGGWHYQYLIQRQAGVQWTLHVQVNLPPCAAVINKWGGLAFNSPQGAALTQPLDGDINLGVDYACR